MRLLGVVDRKPRGERLGDRRGDVLAPRVQRADRGDDLRRVGRLVQVAHGAGLQRADRVLVLGVHREHQHADASGVLGERVQHVEPAATRQVDVEQQHVELGVAGELAQLAVVGRLADDADVAGLVQRVAQPAPDQRVVIDDDDADHASDSSSSREAARSVSGIVSITAPRRSPTAMSSQPWT